MEERGEVVFAAEVEHFSGTDASDHVNRTGRSILLARELA
jgi:hypothetical protein